MMLLLMMKEFLFCNPNRNMPDVPEANDERSSPMSVGLPRPGAICIERRIPELTERRLQYQYLLSCLRRDLETTAQRCTCFDHQSNARLGHIGHAHLGSRLLVAHKPKDRTDPSPAKGMVKVKSQWITRSA